MSLKRLSPEVFAAAVAARDVDQLIELLRPFVAKVPGAKRTVGVRQMSPDDLRRYNAENQRRLRAARAKARAQNLTPDDHADEELTELAGMQWQAMRETESRRNVE